MTWIIRRRYGHRLDRTPKEMWVRRAVWLVFALNLISVIGIAGLITYGLSNIEFLGEKGRPWFWFIPIIGVLGAVGTIVVLYNAFLAWARTGSGWWWKACSALFVLACLGFLWFAYAGNLFILRSTY